MDVGLNNRNKLGEIRPEFNDVVFLVEATSTEQFNIWQEWAKDSITNIKPISDSHIAELAVKLNYSNLYLEIKNLNDKVKANKQNRVDWEQINSGFGITIDQVNHKGRDLPICVDFSFAIVNGKKICFYNNCSMACDSKIVEDWLIQRFQLTNDNYTRWNHTDAGNFHNCVHALDRLDKEPRDTVFVIDPDHYM